jgi:hypothetical protein
MRSGEDGSAAANRTHEGVAFAKEHPDQCTAGLLTNPAEIMGPNLAYSEREWRQFRKGALSVLKAAYPSTRQRMVHLASAELLAIVDRNSQ